MKKFYSRFLKGVNVLFIIWFVAFMLNTFFLSIYKVPTKSMLPNVVPGDYIFVDKFGYGEEKKMFGRVFSCPKLRDLNRGDIIAFHFPEGDTVFQDYPLLNYYEFQENDSTIPNEYYCLNVREKIFLPIKDRIVYVKRCIGMPGEVLQIVNGEILINNNPKVENYKLMNVYKNCSNSKLENQKWDSSYTYSESSACRSVISTWNFREDVSYKMTSFFPRKLGEEFNWDAKNYGPVKIPRKGTVIKLDTSNIAFYSRLISTYEGNDLQITETNIYINNKLTDIYVPTQNYYFMLGDNRGGSIDSRNWGFVPEDHIVGKVFCTSGLL
jgi:signal peptidase I